MTGEVSSGELESLQNQQSLLLQALLGDQKQAAAASARFSQRGLQAYQAHGEALAERALQAAYPVIAQLIGDENFRPMSRHYWQQHPPRCSDMAFWGGDLPGFIEAAVQLADEAYLADVARVEWALHRIQTAANGPLDAPSFALLASHDPDQLTLALCPGAEVFSSPHPVASIVNAHLVGEPPLAEAARLLRDGIGEHTLVWRQGFKPRARHCEHAEFTLINRMKAGCSLASALEAALASATVSPGDSVTDAAIACFDFNHWLSQSVQDGLITGALQLPSTAHNL